MWLILSDSHDNLHKAKEIERMIIKNNIKKIFHCGDFVAPFILPYFVKEEIEFYGVFGNNDGERLLLTQRSNGKIKVGPRDLTIDNYRILMMHEPFALEAAKSSNLYDFIFFGHTHEIYTEQTEKTLIINPGESSGWLTGKSSIILLEPKSKKLEVLYL